MDQRLFGTSATAKPKKKSERVPHRYPGSVQQPLPEDQVTDVIHKTKTTIQAMVYCVTSGINSTGQFISWGTMLTSGYVMSDFPLINNSWFLK